MDHSGRREDPGFSLRRLRTTTLKESSATEENSDGRLKKKESGSSQQSMKKRKRHQEPQTKARITPEKDASIPEDEDMSPPPPLSRRPTKKAFPQGKISDEGSAMGLSAVPRKARTAVMKRPQEVSSLPPMTDTNKQQQSSNNSNTLPPSSNTRRLKPSTGKAKGPKMPKISSFSSSSSISEQEVEVAEALFNLARMVTSHESLEARTESTTHDHKQTSPLLSSSSVQTVSPILASEESTPSIIPTPAPSSPSHSTTIPPSEAVPKRKHHQIIPKPGECISAHSQLGSPSLATVGASNLEPKEEQLLACSPERETSLGTPISASPLNSNATLITQLAEKDRLISEDIIDPPMGETLAESVPADNELPLNASSIEKESVSEEKLPDLNSDENEKNVLADISDPPDLKSVERQSETLPSISLLPRFQIDLMQEPPTETDALEDENVEGAASLSGIDKIAEGNDKGIENDIHGEEEKPQVSDSKDFSKKDKHKWSIECPSQSETKVQTDVWNEGQREKQKAELSKQSVRSPKADSRIPKIENSGSSLSIQVSTSPFPSCGSNNNQALSISMGMAGWPASLPPFSYYSPGAAWPASINGGSVKDGGAHTLQVGPFMFPVLRQKIRKSCARHVYIAHFIASGQHEQTQRQPPVWVNNATTGMEQQLNHIPHSNEALPFSFPPPFNGAPSLAHITHQQEVAPQIFSNLYYNAGMNPVWHYQQNQSQSNATSATNGGPSSHHHHHHHHHHSPNPSLSSPSPSLQMQLKLCDGPSLPMGNLGRTLGSAYPHEQMRANREDGERTMNSTQTLHFSAPKIPLNPDPTSGYGTQNLSSSPFTQNKGIPPPQRTDSTNHSSMINNNNYNASSGGPRNASSSLLPISPFSTTKASPAISKKPSSGRRPITIDAKKSEVGGSMDQIQKGMTRQHLSSSLMQSQPIQNQQHLCSSSMQSRLIQTNQPIQTQQHLSSSLMQSQLIQTQQQLSSSPIMQSPPIQTHFQSFPSLNSLRRPDTMHMSGSRSELPAKSSALNPRPRSPVVASCSSSGSHKNNSSKESAFPHYQTSMNSGQKQSGSSPGRHPQMLLSVMEHPMMTFNSLTTAQNSAVMLTNTEGKKKTTSSNRHQPPVSSTASINSRQPNVLVVQSSAGVSKP